MKKEFNTEALLEYASRQVAQRVDINALDRDAWMELHAEQRLLSGRLTHAWRNRELYKSFPEAGIDWEEQYIRERIQLTFGYGAEAVPASRLTFAPVKIEHGDTALTETCWFTDVFNAKAGSCVSIPAQIDVDYSTGEKKSGVGLRIVFKNESDRPKWLPRKYEIFAFTSQVTTRSDGKRIQSAVQNPGLMTQFSGVESEVTKDLLLRRIQDQHCVGRQQWIDKHRISETLARNIQLSKAEDDGKNAYVFHNHYLHERAATEWGYGFDVAPKSSIKIGPAISEGDSDPHVQIGRFIHLLNENDIFGDRFLARHLNVTDMWGTQREGLGIIVEHAHRPAWIGDNTAYALVAEVDPKTGSWLPVYNPC